MLILKIGGNQLDSPAFLGELAGLVATLPQPPVIVHGGGRGTTELSQRLGLESRFLDGLRVTDHQALEAAVMGLVGKASLQLVAPLVQRGVPALGLCGADAGLVTAERLHHPRGDLGEVGTPSAVDTARLEALAKAGFVPCLAPICLSPDRDILNVNADHVAAAVAVALKAEALVFVTATPGILVDGAPSPRLTPQEIEHLIDRGVIGEGMIPKARSACEALTRGVKRVLITDLEGVARWAGGTATPTEVAAS